METQNAVNVPFVKQLRTDVDRICLPQGRRVGTAGHREVEGYLLRRLEEIGCEPYSGDSIRLPYESEGQSFVNLIGRIPGTNAEAGPPLLIGAHYDSVIDSYCADDNAAAVAIALAVGKLAREGAFKRDLIVAIFDAEEPPYFQSRSMGSNYFVEHQMKDEGVHAVIIMDLVGHDVPGAPGLEDLIFVTGMESHHELQNAFSMRPKPKELKVVPTLNSYVGDMSDHGAFRKRGVPYFFLSCGHWQHYHMPTDTPDRLNYSKMAAIAHLNLGLLEGMDSYPMPRGDKEVFHETLDVEISSLRNAFGAFLPEILKQAGMDAIRSRGDMDRLVSLLRGRLSL